MKLLLLTALALTLALCAAKKDDTKLWAVLVAGSNTYGNYRHQADVCHAYQIMHNHGIPDENIIVMMYDDIAENEENPMKGKIINHVNGPDVYHGVPKDYTREHVTPENFVKIITGEEMTVGSRKTLKSGPNDHVFINFVDHGAPGLVAFPNGELSAKKFIAALNKMHEKKMYNKMVIYVEACESGSMFHNKLKPDINIYATTAANPKESSYACYWSDKLETYLGDTYSVKWMEDSDKENIEVETLLKQYEITKKETNESHVQEYGDMALNSLPVGDFQGETNPKKRITLPTATLNQVRSVDVQLETQRRLLSKATTKEEKERRGRAIFTIMKKRSLVKRLFQNIANHVTADKAQAKRLTSAVHEFNDMDCHDTVVTAFSQNCLNIGKNQYVTRHIQTLVNMCEEKLPVDRIVNTIKQECAKFPLDKVEGAL